MLHETASVLVVDDDRADIKAVQRAFAKQKIANPITVAANGVEALKILRGEEGYDALPRPYVILLDLNMPQMNGLEFLDAIRRDEDLRQSVVFVLTTSDQDRDRAAAYDKCIAGYIVKAEAGDGFLQVTRMLDAYWRVVMLPR